MNRNSQPHPEERVPGNNALAILVRIPDAFAFSVEVFLRCNMGSRYQDAQAAIALFLIPGFGLFFPGEDLRPLFVFLAAFVFACGVQRTRSLRRRFRGEEGHSYYNGWPRILRLPMFRLLSEDQAKATAEPWLVIAAGAFTILFNRPLGIYLIVAAFGLCVSRGLRKAHERHRLMNMRDAYYDQRHMSEQFRRRRW